MAKTTEIKFYHYPKCSTCVKALKFLRTQGREPRLIDITEHPPSKAELKKMLGLVGDVRKLFNTSGVQYRELGLSDKLKTLGESAALDLLAGNGRLVKRPFVLWDDAGTVGFNEATWNEAFRPRTR